MKSHEGIDQWPDYDLPGCATEPGRIIIYMRLRGIHLNVNVQEQNLIRSPVALENLRTSILKVGSVDDEDEADLWEYKTTIASHCLAALQDFAPHVNHVGKLTLNDLRRELCECQVEFRDEVPCIGSIRRVESDEEDGTGYQPGLAPGNWPFPQFLPSDVEIPYEDGTNIFDIVPEKVFVHGRPFFWKSACIFEEAKNEIEKHIKIQRSGVSTHKLRTPRLYGLVVDHRGALRGQLHHLIDIGSHLTWDVLEKTPKTMRLTWISQIRDTVETMHAIDVVWGSVKADNIVIDKNGDAVVLSLEDSTTREWNDADRMGTKEGDLQGLQRLEEYILDELSPLRVEDKRLDCEDDLAQDLEE